jgi:hypothetical protein
MVDTGELNIKKADIEPEFERVENSFNAVCKYLFP